tara:strand:- start:2341 stop:2541 length:201 start_codon:yes stop_codon:yes gene_type:complete
MLRDFPVSQQSGVYETYDAAQQARYRPAKVDKNGYEAPGLQQSPARTRNQPNNGAAVSGTKSEFSL